MNTIATNEADLDPTALEVEFADVMQMTREVFENEPHIEVDPDPEIVGFTRINFCVVSAFESRVLVQKLKIWHQRLDELRPEFDRRLGINWEPVA